jgi:arginase
MVSTSSLSRYVERSLEGQTIRIVQIPTDWGKPSVGAQDGPSHVMTVGGLERHLQQAGANLIGSPVPVARREHRDTPPVVENEGLRNVNEMLSAGLAGGALVRQALSSGEKVLSLRGDHSGALDLIGALQAFPDPRDPAFSTLRIIWIDTHPDINGASDSLNGHGKMVRTLLGEGHPQLSEIMKSVPKLRPQNIIYVGVSQPDNPEIETLKRLNIKCFTSDDLEENKNEMYQTINHFVSSGSPCWLEFDQDSMSDAVSQGTFMPNGGEGLTPREVYSIARRFHFGGHGVGVGIAEVVPKLDNNGESAKIAAGLASRALGAGNPLYNHGGYDTDAERAAAKTERAEITALARALEQTSAGLEELRHSTGSMKRIDRRTLLSIAITMGMTNLAANLVQSTRRPALLDDAVFRSAASDFKEAQQDGDDSRRAAANDIMQSMIHLSLHAAKDDMGLKDGVWNAVRRELGDYFADFQREYRTIHPYD